MDGHCRYLNVVRKTDVMSFSWIIREARILPKIYQMVHSVADAVRPNAKRLTTVR